MNFTYLHVICASFDDTASLRCYRVQKLVSAYSLMEAIRVSSIILRFFLIMYETTQLLYRPTCNLITSISIQALILSAYSEQSVSRIASGKHVRYTNLHH
jgi:hypothetical protein